MLYARSSAHPAPQGHSGRKGTVDGRSSFTSPVWDNESKGTRRAALSRFSVVPGDSLNLVERMRLCASRSRSIFRRDDCSSLEKRSDRRGGRCFRKSLAWPSQAKSVVDPGTCRPRRGRLPMHFSRLQRKGSGGSWLPMTMLLADRFTRTVAPASAANVLGGIGTHTSSQISAWSAKSLNVGAS